MTIRKLDRIIPSLPTSDGAGVKLRRSIGATPERRLDPFLMLDEFGTDRPEDYIAGFPPHPHRGFETVTYMLDGHMRHEDHLGNVGELTAGGVQWMTAGRGVIHSEMPQQEQGRMRGFQLWINLPAAEKMVPARYRDIPAAQIPQLALAAGSVKVIAGTCDADGQRASGPISGLTTQPLFFDVALAPGARFEHAVPTGHAAFVYVYEGELNVGPDDAARVIPTQAAGVLGAGERVRLTGGATPTRAILLAARPLGEPVVQHGPFVMNSRAEIEQAIEDYRLGRLTDGGAAAAPG